MEDKRMKDFDRHIERSMNEYAVAPPFGMWNRIQNELDGTTKPIAAPAPSTPLVPRGVLMGFISGAALISALVGGFLYYNGGNQTGVNQGLSNNGGSNIVEVTSQMQQPVIAQLTTSTQHTVEPTIVSIAPAKNETAVNTAITPAQEEKTTIAVENQLTANSETAIAVQQNAETKAEDGYYFPPVDINTGAKNEQVVDALYRGYNSAEPNADSKVAEVKKTKSSSSSSNVKFKKKKKSRGGFSYGRLNRLKPSKNN